MKQITIDFTTQRIAWANRGKNKPANLYVGDATVRFERINPEALVEIQSDSKYTFYVLTLTKDGKIPELGTAPKDVAAKAAEEAKGGAAPTAGASAEPTPSAPAPAAEKELSEEELEKATAPAAA